MARTISVNGRTRPIENDGITLVKAPTLEALGMTARHEIGQTQRAANKAMQHALVAGETLMEAKGRMKLGEWGPWLDQYSIDDSTASTYMRIARFRDALVGVESVQQAKAVLKEKGLRIQVTYDGELTYQIKQLRSEGLSQREVGKRLGVSDTTVRKRIRDAAIGTRQIGGHNRRKPITDEMIEGMAIWLRGRDHTKVDDIARREATDALRAALTYRGSIGSS